MVTEGLGIIQNLVGVQPGIEWLDVSRVWDGKKN